MNNTHGRRDGPASSMPRILAAWTHGGLEFMLQVGKSDNVEDKCEGFSEEADVE